MYLILIIHWLLVMSVGIQCTCTCMTMCLGANVCDEWGQASVHDLHDWCEYCGAEFNWPNTFPIHSVLPLRLTLASNCQPTLIKAICKSLTMYIVVMLILYFVCTCVLAIVNNLLCASSNLSLHENSVGLSFTTNPKPKEQPSHYLLRQTCSQQKAEWLTVRQELTDS